MSDLFLIAHKVRGEPAFDIAEQIEMPWGREWVIPTSGHRAHPYFHIGLDKLLGVENILQVVGPMPTDLPDHYHISDYTNRATRPPRSAAPRLEDI